MKRFRGLIGIALIICLITGLTACNLDDFNNKQSDSDNTVTATVTPAVDISQNKNTEVTPEPTKEAAPAKKTLVYATSELSGKFSPFFAVTSYDMDIVNLTQGSLLVNDRSGAMLMNALEGEKTVYNGTEYTYSSLGNCVINQNEDGTTDYNFTMRDDVFFSDGVKATIDDVIFGLYVISDPSYDGALSFASLPVVGMKEYRNSMEPLYKLIVKKGRSNTDFTYWDEETQNAFWQAADQAGYLFVKDICTFCEEKFGKLGEDNSEEDNSEEEASVAAVSVDATAQKENGEDTIKEESTDSGSEEDTEKAADGTNEISESENIPENAGQEIVELSPEEEAAQVRRAMFFWGYEDDWIDGMLIEDFWNIMCREYKDDLLLLQENEAILKNLWEYMPEFDEKYNISVDVSSSVKNISGIKKTGDYSLTVTLEKNDNSSIYNMPLYVVPMHYYGDEKLYDYDASSFGFVKGDLTGIIEKNDKPLGCGPYVFDSHNGVYVTLKANENYFLGRPAVDNLVLMESESTAIVDELLKGNVDMAVVSRKEDIDTIKSSNSDSQTTGNNISAIPVKNNGFGYIGCSASLVNVGKTPSSYKSKCLRKAFMTLFSLYREEAVTAYFGDLAEVIQYPVSDVSWSAPEKGGDGYRNAFILTYDGNEIYSETDSETIKHDKVISAVIGYFKEAGYVWDENSKSFTAAGENAKLAYDIVIPGGGYRDHPAFMVADRAAEELAKIGIILNIKNVSVSTWESVLLEDKADFWAGALHTSIDPDMYEIYHSDNLKNDSRGMNFFSIKDSALDELIISGRENTAVEERKNIYRQAYDIVMDWAVELPFYQKNEFIVVSGNVDNGTLPENITPYYGWYSEIERLKMKE